MNVIDMVFVHRAVSTPPVPIFAHAPRNSVLKAITRLVKQIITKRFSFTQLKSISRQLNSIREKQLSLQQLVNPLA